MARPAVEDHDAVDGGGWIFFVGLRKKQRTRFRPEHLRIEVLHDFPSQQLVGLHGKVRGLRPKAPRIPLPPDSGALLCQGGRAGRGRIGVYREVPAVGHGVRSGQDAGRQRRRKHADAQRLIRALQLKRTTTAKRRLLAARRPRSPADGGPDKNVYEIDQHLPRKLSPRFSGGSSGANLNRR